MRVVIYVESGCVQEVVTTEDCEVVVYDFDTEGADEEDLITVSNSWNKNKPAYRYIGDIHTVNKL